MANLAGKPRMGLGRRTPPCFARRVLFNQFVHASYSPWSARRAWMGCLRAHLLRTLAILPCGRSIAISPCTPSCRFVSFGSCSSYQARTSRHPSTFSSSMSVPVANAWPRSGTNTNFFAAVQSWMRETVQSSIVYAVR